MGRVFVIGIGGTTNSGKSTIARQLVEAVPNSTSICQDAYFIEPGDPRLKPLEVPELKHHNWEDYRALEMDRMVADVRRLIMSHNQQTEASPDSYIFIEGFSIFGWRPLCKLFDLKYFLSVDKETCAERRKQRDYNPPDVAGYFEQIVWPMHLKHLRLIEEQTDIEYMSSSTALEDKVATIMGDIQKKAQTPRIQA